MRAILKRTSLAANKKYKEVLESYEVPELPADVDKDLQKFIEDMK